MPCGRPWCEDRRRANKARSKQLIHRQPAEFVGRVLKDFNKGLLAASDAAARLGISRTRLYELRADYLRKGLGYSPQASGGNQRGAWPARVIAFLEEFLPLQSPPNYQLVADEILQMEIERQNRTVNRSTGKVPDEVAEQQILTNTSRLRPCPRASLLDLHFSLRTTRRVNPGYTIDFDGVQREIAPTARKIVTVLFHPGQKLWVLEELPTDRWPKILGAFTL